MVCADNGGEKMTPDPDFTLYASTGVHDAFRRLVERHIAHVHAAAYRRLGACSHLAADVTQSVFVKLARVARALPAETCLGMWLHRQAVSMSIDAIRSELRRRTREQTAVAMQHDSASPTVDWRQSSLHLDDALERLPAPDRAAVVMRFFEQREFAEVGAALGTTPEAARKRISRALEKLRERLSKRGVAVSVVALESLLRSESVRAVSAGLTERVVAAGTSAGKSVVASFITAVASRWGLVGAGAVAAWIVSGVIYWRVEVHAKPMAAVAEAGGRAAINDPAATLTEPVAAAEREPRTIPEIVAAIKVLYEGPSSLRKSLTIDALLRKVRPADYAAFFQLAGTEIGTGDRIELWIRTLHAWIKAPEALTRAMLAVDSAKADSLVSRFLVMPSITREADENGNLHFSRIDMAFKAWLKADPESAARWLLENHETPLLARRIFPTRGEGSLLDFLMAGFLRSKEAVDSPAGRALAESLAASGGTRTAYDTYVAQLFYRDGDAERTPVEALRNIAAQFIQTGNTDALRTLGFCWAQRRRDEFESETAGPSFPGRYWLALGAASGEQDRGRWAKVALSRRNESGHPNAALTDVVDAWLTFDAGQFDALVPFIRENAAPEEFSPALVRAAQQMARNSALTELAMRIAVQIPDVEQRNLMLRGLYRRLLEIDPKAASGFIARNRWPADQLAVISDLNVP